MPAMRGVSWMKECYATERWTRNVRGSPTTRAPGHRPSAQAEQAGPKTEIRGNQDRGKTSNKGFTNFSSS